MVINPFSPLRMNGLAEHPLGDGPGGTEVGIANLRCAEGLPGADALDVPPCLRQLDDWADLVRRGTERMLPKFHAASDEYQRSEAYFRILVMVTLLQRNLGIEYNSECMAGAADCRDSRKLFLHGLLETRQGTCLSMPVLYVAIARRLGYPVYLVGAKQHLFARWDDQAGERFNIECTSRGLNCYPDDHYHRWPVALTVSDLAGGCYLRSYSGGWHCRCVPLALPVPSVGSSAHGGRHVLAQRGYAKATWPRSAPFREPMRFLVESAGMSTLRCARA